MAANTPTPNLILPSWRNFARNAGESLFPSLWRGKVLDLAPVLGPTGSLLRDVSGFGNHATLNNMDPATDWVVHKGRGHALDFDGGDDDLTVIASSSINNVHPVSIIVFMDVGSFLVGNPRLFNKNVGDGFVFRNAGGQNNTLKFEYSTSGTNVMRVAADNAVSENAIQTVGMTWDGSLTATGILFYVDGPEVASYQETQNGSGSLDDDSGTNLQIFDSVGGGVETDATVWEVLMYNRVLTPAEMFLCAIMPYTSLYRKDFIGAAIEQAAVAGFIHSQGVLLG